MWTLSLLMADLHNLPPDLDPAKVCTHQISDNRVAFPRGQSPLSNYYIANFHVNKTVYDCQECHYIRNKADFANRPDLIKSVMNAETPNNCHKIAKQIDRLIDLDEWQMNHAIVVMACGVRAKFKQNTYLRNFLLETGDKSLVEMNPYDKYWSCGLRQTDTDKIMDVINWPGNNHLGHILEDLKDSLKT